jgi:phospholipase C
VFDHTSVLQFLEKFLSHKSGKKIEESNISAWRRTICGDLTSVFKPYDGGEVALPKPVSKNNFVESIHKAQFKKEPSGFHPLTPDEIAAINGDPSASPLHPKQEKGVRASCALPYQLYASGEVTGDGKAFRLTMECRKEIFGEETAGAPFQVYALGREWMTRSYAVAAGDSLTDSWDMDAFEHGDYHFRVCGPNGFLREFIGNVRESLGVTIEYERNGKQVTGDIQLTIRNKTGRNISLEIKDNGYRQPIHSKAISPAASATILLDLSKSFGWYDASIGISGNPLFTNRFAGRVETGKDGYTDPAMG